MMLGTVVGRVWSDRQLDGLAGRRLLIVQELDGPGRPVAVDLVDVGVGAVVLVTTDEAAAAACGESTVDAAVIALVSNYDTGERRRSAPIDVAEVDS
jgi:ethanolamine utilization protein EutN